ncbi:MAG: hypothetical protein LBK25_03685 [Treponema sp.]|nr:hypothetical protein [Treponema sp.]
MWVRAERCQSRVRAERCQSWVRAERCQTCGLGDSVRPRKRAEARGAHHKGDCVPSSV